MDLHSQSPASSIDHITITGIPAQSIDFVMYHPQSPTQIIDCVEVPLQRPAQATGSMSLRLDNKTLHSPAQSSHSLNQPRNPDPLIIPYELPRSLRGRSPSVSPIHPVRSLSPTSISSWTTCDVNAQVLVCSDAHNNPSM
jgi:hypothetical protein